MKIAFFVSEFPSVSETFIQNQILGVLERGHEVTIFAKTGRRDIEVSEDVKKNFCL